MIPFEFFSFMMIIIPAGMTTVFLLAAPTPTSSPIMARSITSILLQFTLVAELAISSQMILVVIVDLISDPKTIIARKVIRFNLTILVMLLISSVTMVALAIPDGSYYTVFFLKQLSIMATYILHVTCAQLFHGDSVFSSGVGFFLLSWLIATAFGNPLILNLSANQLICEECSFTAVVIIIVMHASSSSRQD
eukprot:gene936-1817_t